MTLLHTFYTIGTPYEAEAKGLMENFASFGVTVKAIGYESKGDWMKNALARAGMLSAIAAKTDQPVGLLDADIRALSKPEKLATDSDFACEFRGANYPANRRYSAGVLVFGNSYLGRRMLETWTRLCMEDRAPKQSLREQFYLCQAVEELHECGDFIFENLGDRYNRKPEKVQPGDDTVLIHSVASRKYLAEIGGVR